MAYPVAPTSITSAGSKRKRDTTIHQSRYFAERQGDEEAVALLSHIEKCKVSKAQEMNRLSDICDRYDDLYFPSVLTDGGADHIPDSPNRAKQGVNHLSLNTYPVYVDVPAALLSIPPIENMLPLDPTAEGASDIAAMVERVYFAWKEDEKFELKAHKVNVVKGLYGRGAVKVYWDYDEKKPCVTVIDQPRNLWLGWSDSDYTRLEWAIYVSKMSPMAILEEFGLDVVRSRGSDGEEYPYITPVINTGASTYRRPTRDWLGMQDFGMVEVHDFWYRKPVGQVREGYRTKMETWNAIMVGNHVLKDDLHGEYDGELPYIPVFNTYIPGVADGRPAFYDIEMLLREKEERLAEGGTLIHKAVSGQFWQLVGADAPDRVPVGLKPKPDQVIAPGAGNRIESIEPWVPEFQLEQYLDRIDREISDASGLNDLLRGLAPAAVLSSSKAINTLVANFEARIMMGRDLSYVWRREVWSRVKTVWGSKDSRIKPIFAAAGRLVLKNPSLTPRDDLETATMATNLLREKVWALSRAMDATGVEDPEAEKDLIREERTDAALFAADVQTQAALMATFQQMGMAQQQAGAQQQPGGPEAMGDAATAARMAANGGQTGMPMMNGAGEQAVPPEQPGNVQDAAMQALMGGGGPIATGPGFNAVSQTQIKGGEPSNRLMLQQPIAPGSEAG